MMNHKEIAFVFGILGNIISFLVFLAPLFTFRRIYRRKSTEDFSSLPYQLALFSSIIWLYYAYLKTDAILLITINSIGCLIETVYIFIYVSYASKRNRILAMKLFFAINLVLCFVIYVVIQYLLKFMLVHYNINKDLHKLRVDVLGWICVVVSVLVFGAPLGILRQVYRTKSVEYLPVKLSYCLACSAIMWFGYGAFTKDIKIAIPNVLGFLLALLQISLYWYYNKRGTVNDTDEEMQSVGEQVKSVVVSGPMNGHEVYSVDIDGDEIEAEKEKDQNAPPIMM